MNWFHDEDGVIRGTIFLIPRFQWCMAFDIDKTAEGQSVEDCQIHGRESEECGWQWRAHDDWLELVADLENSRG